MRAEVGVTFLPGPMSKLNARVDSDRFRFHVWVSAYAGLEGRYPEAGVYFGWNSKNVTRLPLEFYVEAIVELEDFETKLRLGGRFEFFRDIWAGAEVEWPGDLLFCRVRWEPRGARGPYVWWRWNGTAGHECAFGYRFDGHISAEIYYDGIESDKIGIRGLWSL
jgi:hypothetical protein